MRLENSGGAGLSEVLTRLGNSNLHPENTWTCGVLLKPICPPNQRTGGDEVSGTLELEACPSVPPDRLRHSRKPILAERLCVDRLGGVSPGMLLLSGGVKIGASGMPYRQLVQRDNRPLLAPEEKKER